MKTRVISALFLLFLILSGCKKDTGDIKLNLRSVSFTADITYYNENYTADCVVDKSGKFSAQITSPENLSGLTITYNADECDIVYNGIEIDNAEKFFPQNSAVGVISGILQNCQGENIISKKGNYELNGSFNGSDYTLIMAPTGLPISLEVGDFGMNVLFENIKIIE